MESFLLEGNVVISQDRDNGFTVNGVEQSTEGTTSATEESTTSSTGTASQNTSNVAQPYAGSSLTVMIIWIVGFAAFFYFFMYRPQKKRDKQVLEERNAIVTGDTILTTSGFYGKVIGIGDTHFMIEFGTNKGIVIPIAKTEVLRKTDMPK